MKEVKQFVIGTRSFIYVVDLRNYVLLGIAVSIKVNSFCKIL